jgi:hypothetical protein
MKNDSIHTVTDISDAAEWLEDNTNADIVAVWNTPNRDAIYTAILNGDETAFTALMTAAGLAW